MMDEIVQLRQRLALLQVEMRQAARGEERARAEKDSLLVELEAARAVIEAVENGTHSTVEDALYAYQKAVGKP